MTEQATDGPEIVEVDAKGNVIEPEAFKRKSGRGRIDEQIDEVAEELAEQCREVGIRESAIRAGGDYRQLSKGKIYWLELAQLLEFELKDIDTEDDQAFFDWFDDYVVNNQLQTKSERTQKRSKSWDGWDTKWDNGPKRMSSWWNEWGWSSYGNGSGSELTRRLAIALKAITTTVSVVNDTGKRYKVKLASQDQPESPLSYTSYGEALIVVSPQALLDTAIDQDDGVEITTGWGLHEASHVKYTTSLLDALTNPTELRPKSVAHILHNILEDLRIEDLTGKKFPGFADYFQTANNYMWRATKDHAPTEWGPTLQDKVNSIVGMAKHPSENQYKPIVDADPGLTAEWPWWREWSEAYVDGKEPIRQGVIRALEHLAEDEDTKQEMEDLTEAEQELESHQGTPLTDEEFKELLKQLKTLLDAGGQVMDPCPSPGQDPKAPGAQFQLTDEQANELEQLIENQYQQHEAFYKMHDGPSDIGPIIEVMRPPEDDYSRSLYRKAGALAERLREVFYFRKTLPGEVERLLKTGQIDEEELWRAGLGDTRVFERSAEPEEHYTSVTMLVDTSGSMVGRGLDKAQELANTMMVCLRTQRGVRTRVRAHTTGSLPTGQTSVVYRIWDPGDPDSRIGLLGSVGHGANFDGFAIDWCAKELNDTAQTSEQKLLIVLSDGLPNGSVTGPNGRVHYGGGPAMDHMRQMGDYWDRQGVKIVQIALDHDGLRPEDQARMFKNWIGYESDRKLLTDMTKLLIKAFGGVE